MILKYDYKKTVGSGIQMNPDFSLLVLRSLQYLTIFKNMQIGMDMWRCAVQNALPPYPNLVQSEKENEHKIKQKRAIKKL